MNCSTSASFSLELSEETKAKLRSFDFDDRLTLENICDDYYLYEITNNRNELHDFSIRFYIEAPNLDDEYRSNFTMRIAPVAPQFSVSWRLIINEEFGGEDEYPNFKNLSISDLILEYLNTFYVDGMTDPDKIDAHYEQGIMSYFDMGADMGY